MWQKTRVIVALTIFIPVVHMCYVNSVAVWTKEKPVLKVETDFPCGYFLMMRRTAIDGSGVSYTTVP